MVFQDYELIHTKRVNRIRRNMDVHAHRMWIAHGGWYTIYYEATAAALSMLLFNITVADIIPTRQFLTKTGFMNYLRTTGLRFWLPIFAGMTVGVFTFGDVFERQRLFALKGIYDRELKDYKREVYYA